MGYLFEQFVGLELVRASRRTNKKMKVTFWRDLSGPEVDWVIDFGGELIPIEVKWSASPNMKDAAHLSIFLDEYAHSKKGYVICRSPHRYKLTDRIEVLPWQD